MTSRLRIVIADDERPARAFELNAVDYLLKPVDRRRLREMLTRAHERLERDEMRSDQHKRVGAAIDAYDLVARPRFIERIPVRRRSEVVIVPVQQIASIVAEGELLHLATINNERYTINHRLKDLERRLDPARFVRLGRGILANVDLIAKVSVMPGGTLVALLTNGQKLSVSRLQARVIRERFLTL